MKLRKYGITLSRLTEKEIELLRNWRNDPKISQYMEVRNHITKEMQIKWFKSIDNDNNYYFIIETNNKKIGLTNIKKIDYEMKQGEWGIFLYEDGCFSSIIPFRAALALLDFAFHNLKLETVYAHILKTNKRAIRFNTGLGFLLKGNQDDVDNQLYELTKENYELSSKRFEKVIY